MRSFVALSRWISTAACVLGSFGLTRSEAAGPKADSKPEIVVPLTFERDIRPILKAHCFHCHGEDGHQEGGLDLRLVRSMKEGGDSGTAFVAGKSNGSLLLERIQSGDMPPGDKPLPAKDAEKIARWIDQGGKTLRPEPANSTEVAITDEERSHWAFQAVSKPNPPKVKGEGLVRSPIDAFLLSRLEAKGLSFSPEADRPTLARRACFDLLGLPPTEEQLREFLCDTAPDAWDRFIDRLLASPHYGERWSRHWLDVAGYADSDGATEKDSIRNHAFRYRDYVIRSFNADKPMDQFIREQLAGDEMIAPPFRNLTTEQAEKITATGFLRMGPDGTGESGAEENVARNDVIAETVKIVSTSLLGLTVGCAQCHAHRFDPIPQADYYAFRAIFEPAYNTKSWRSKQDRLVCLMSDTEQAETKKVDAELARLAKEREATLQSMADVIFDREIVKAPAELHAALREAYKTPIAKRTPEQKKLLAAHPTLNLTISSVYLYDRKAADSFEKAHAEKVAKVKATRPEERFAVALTEPSAAPPATFLFYRGDISQPRQQVSPSELTVLASAGAKTIAADDPKLPTTGRRLAYAHWLTSPQHPLTARVLVNRVWLQHFGRGIVGTPSDFGIAGDRPTHPELLDYLASDFIASGWKLKLLHKRLMTAAVYQQSSRRTAALEAADPENRLYGRMSVRRLEAEMVRDAVLACAGKLNPKMFGPPIPVRPDEVGQIVVGKDDRDSAGRPKGKPESIGDEAFRRSLYVQTRRSTPLGMLETFDGPRMAPNCEIRNCSTVAPQSLLLLNNQFVIEESESMAKRVRRLAGDTLEDQARSAWRLAYAADPMPEQLTGAVSFLKTQTDVFAKRAAESKSKPKEPVLKPEEQALAAFCQTLVSSNRFLYVD